MKTHHLKIQGIRDAIVIQSDDVTIRPSGPLVLIEFTNRSILATTDTDGVAFLCSDPVVESFIVSPANLQYLREVRHG